VEDQIDTDFKGTPPNEIKIFKRKAFVIRNFKFEKVHQHITELNKLVTDKGPTDLTLPKPVENLNEDHQNTEEKTMVQGLTELGYDVRIEDMSTDGWADPFQAMENLLLEIR
jgi:hypothetical protein